MNMTSNDIAAVTKVIESHQRILVIPHANVDPDGLSSALALYLMLKSMGKEVTVICPDTLPETLRFLPGFSDLRCDVDESQEFVITINLEEGVEVDKLRYAVEDNKVNIIVVPKNGAIRPSHISFGDGEKPFDLIIVVDTADLNLLGGFYTKNIDIFSQIPVLNIDHHISNTGFGQIQLIDPTAASATEVLYSLFCHVPLMKERLTPDIATLLLAGLISDTRSFQNPNTTPRSLEVASDLLEIGGRQQEIIRHIYKTKPLSTLKIWGRALNRIQLDPNARIVWSAVSKEDLTEMSAKSCETHGILDELISTIPDADIYILFTEIEDGGFKASMRSSNAVDASVLSGKLFGGGGHARAAGFKIKTYDNFQLEVLEVIRKIKEEIKKDDVVVQTSESSTVKTVLPTVVHPPVSSVTNVSDNGSSQSNEYKNLQETDILEGLVGEG